MNDTRQPSTSDLRAIWKRAEARLKAMTPEERVGTLVDAGILTRGGRLTKPYKNLGLALALVRSKQAEGK